MLTSRRLKVVAPPVCPPTSSDDRLPARRDAMRYTAALWRGRAAWKGPSFVVLPGMAEARKTGAPIRTKALQATIIPNYVGLKVLAYTGKDWQPITVTDEMVGFKLYDFVRTHKPWRFKGEAEPAY